MKTNLFLLLAIIAAACSPNVNYLGDTYAPTDHVDVYYDEADISKDFRVMGQISGDNSTNSFIKLEEIKEGMIEEAKSRGADGIWFLFADSYENDHVVRAKLIKYRN